MFRIGIEIMSGDEPPEELIQGCLKAAKTINTNVTIIGQEELIKKELKRHKYPKERISILHASEVITMSEHPSQACRSKKDSSLMVGMRALKEGVIDSLFSPGNTGAVLAGALMTVGRIKGVKRPAIGSPIPTKANHCLLIDAGANIDCNWKYLKQFAIIGNVYFQQLFNIQAPRIALLNIGEESSKGDELSIKVYKELSKSPLNFIGNIEPKDVLDQKADVIICDGFVGNIFLKTAEGTARMIVNLMKEKIKKRFSTTVGALLMKPVFRAIKTRTDSKKYGGAPLLGINKPVYIGHGSSNGEAIYNAIKTCHQGLKADLTTHIQEAIKIHG